MDKQEAIAKLKEQQGNYNQEDAHVEADDILCGLLNTLGYDDVVKEYEAIEKWYG